MKNFLVLGATGSIGTQALDVIEEEKHNLIGFSFGKNYEKAKTIIERFKPKYVCAIDELVADELQKLYGVIAFSGEEGLKKLCKINEEFTVINALYGISGLMPMITAIENKHNCIVSNKESIVIAGDFIQNLALKNKVSLLPLDSEHTAILQELNNKEAVKNLYITSSGGAFKNYSRTELNDVTLEMALKHPTWNMGKMITLNSATMMNKCFEIIEAHYYFDVDYDHIFTLLHPESLVHAIVEYENGVYTMVMSTNDMRVPISYTINYPNCVYTKFSKDKIASLSINIRPMDEERYPLIKLAYKVGKTGKDMPAAFSAANDAALHLFIEKKIAFLDIERIIFYVIDNFTIGKAKTVADLIKTYNRIYNFVYYKKW